MSGSSKQAISEAFPSQYANRIRLQLDVMDAAAEIRDLNRPGWELHELKGDRKGTWAIKVSGDSRTTFGFAGGNAYHVSLEDYH